MASQDKIPHVMQLCHKATAEHGSYNCAGDLYFRGKLEVFSILVLITATVLVPKSSILIV